MQKDEAEEDAWPMPADQHFQLVSQVNGKINRKLKLKVSSTFLAILGSHRPKPKYRNFGLI
jgi:hypothetical protein